MTYNLNLFLKTNDIHIIVNLSPIMQSHSYSLSHVINTGLCIVYLNQSVYADRLHPDLSPRYIPIQNYSSNVIVQGVLAAVRYTASNAGIKSGYRVESHNIQPNRWYLENYPIRVI